MLISNSQNSDYIFTRYVWKSTVFITKAENLMYAIINAICFIGTASTFYVVRWQSSEINCYKKKKESFLIHADKFTLLFLFLKYKYEFLDLSVCILNINACK